MFNKIFILLFIILLICIISNNALEPYTYNEPNNAKFIIKIKPKDPNQSELYIRTEKVPLRDTNDFKNNPSYYETIINRCGKNKQYANEPCVCGDGNEGYRSKSGMHKCDAKGNNKFSWEVTTEKRIIQKYINSKNIVVNSITFLNNNNEEIHTQHGNWCGIFDDTSEKVIEVEIPWRLIRSKDNISKVKIKFLSKRLANINCGGVNVLSFADDIAGINEIVVHPYTNREYFGFFSKKMNGGNNFKAENIDEIRHEDVLQGSFNEQIRFDRTAQSPGMEFIANDLITDL